MHLSFDSIGELQDFLNFVGYVKPVDMTVTFAGTKPNLAELIAHEIQAGGEDDGGTVDVGNEQPMKADESPAATEKPKRTRKSKAETPATDAAALSGDISGTTSAGAAASESQSVTVTANPFAAVAGNASTATQAILSAENQQQSTLAGIAAMQTPPDDAADDSEVAHDADKSPEMSAPEHMKLCREFIAKHGQAKYMEAFQLAGLTSAITTYTPEQRAQHVATLALITE